MSGQCHSLPSEMIITFGMIDISSFGVSLSTPAYQPTAHQQPSYQTFPAQHKSSSTSVIISHLSSQLLRYKHDYSHRPSFATAQCSLISQAAFQPPPWMAHSTYYFLSTSATFTWSFFRAAQNRLSSRPMATSTYGSHIWAIKLNSKSWTTKPRKDYSFIFAPTTSSTSVPHPSTTEQIRLKGLYKPSSGISSPYWPALIRRFQSIFGTSLYHKLR